MNIIFNFLKIEAIINIYSKYISFSCYGNNSSCLYFKDKWAKSRLANLFKYTKYEYNQFNF